MKIKWGLVFVLSAVAVSAQAACFLGDALMAKKNYAAAKETYQMCSHVQNDAGAQYALGQIYKDGLGGTKQDLKLALFYFRFAAENGSAAAQRELAQLMMSLERMGAPGQEALREYENKIHQIKGRDEKGVLDLKPLPMSAYAWMLLAAEKPENKWFYPTAQVQDEQARRLLLNMERQYGKAAKEQAIREASAWKEEKLIWAAKTTLTEPEYQQFMDAVYPKGKTPNQALRQAQVAKLKQRVQGTSAAQIGK